MVDILVIVSLLLWLLGQITSITLDGLTHVLLVIAVVLVLMRLISGRPPV